MICGKTLSTIVTRTTGVSDPYDEWVEQMIHILNFQNQVRCTAAHDPNHLHSMHKDFVF